MSTALLNCGRIYNMAVPAGTTSGDPIANGFITGNAVNDRDAAGNADVDIGFVTQLWDIPITARVAIGNIAVGDRLYYDTVNNVVDNDGGVNHVPFGLAFEALAIVGGVDTSATREVLSWTF